MHSKGSGLCAPCSICECGCQSVGKGEVNGCTVCTWMRPVTLFAAVLVLCAWHYLAVRRGWRCYCVCPRACAVRLASFPHDTALLCAGQWREVEMCEGVSVAVVSSHLPLPRTWQHSAAYCSTKPWIEKM
ncbi:elongation factor 1-gamma (EF-1-gamma) [Trypanosoma cruzi]|nr:elongation factor 1-gamma (EF-1-gamma) [Trypanosoma cruzi]